MHYFYSYYVCKNIDIPNQVSNYCIGMRQHQVQSLILITLTNLINISMANITISNIPTFNTITEIDKQSMTNIIGGCKAKYRRDGSLRKFKNCSPSQIKEILA